MFGEHVGTVDTGRLTADHFDGLSAERASGSDRGDGGACAEQTGKDQCALYFHHVWPPNVCKADGSIWFTDPTFGILGWYEGAKAEPEIPTHVYRIDPSGALSVVAEGINQPNGLAFSPDESILYIVESRSVPRKILAFDVVGGKSLAKRRVLIDAGPKGTPDGFRVDTDGNLWCGWGMGDAGLDGVHVFNPDGRLIGRIELPERCANVCFGGVHRNRLFMAATTSLYALYVNSQGVAGG